MTARWPHMAPRNPRRPPQDVQDASRGPQQGPRNLRRHPRTPSRMGLLKKMRTGKDSQGMARTRTKNRKEDEREKDDNKDNVKTKTETRTYALSLSRSLYIYVYIYIIYIYIYIYISWSGHVTTHRTKALMPFSKTRKFCACTRHAENLCAYRNIELIPP